MKNETHSESKLTAANSFSDVQSNMSGKTYYWENNSSRLFLKLKSNYQRQGRDYCGEKGCERWNIKANLTSAATAVPNCLPTK
jgi:cell migration-inducing and hyaluronan-binding protein